MLTMLDGKERAGCDPVRVAFESPRQFQFAGGR